MFQAAPSDAVGTPLTDRWGAVCARSDRAARADEATNRTGSAGRSRQRGVREWHQAGLQTRPVPARGGVDVAFPVSFDDADAEVGHVTFSARATLVGAGDATPDDNALTAPPTPVAQRRRP